MKAKAEAKKRYPENVYCEIFSVSAYPDLPEDAEETIEYVMDSLKPREKSFIIAKFKQGHTYVDIGELNGLSKSRSSQITEMGLRKLRMSCHREILVLGREAYLTDVISKQEARKADYIQKISKLEQYSSKLAKEVDQLQVRHDLIMLAAEIDIPNDVPLEIIDRIISMEVMELRLSVRTYNCLIREGLTMVKQILDNRRLLRVRDLSPKGYHEIQKALESFLKEQYRQIQNEK